VQDGWYYNMAITLNGTTGITTPTYGGSVPSEYITPVTSFKNRIINGAMTIDQRNAGASFNTPSGLINTYSLDRWRIRGDTTGIMTVQQSSVAPTGFSNSLSITTQTADAAIGSTAIYLVQQLIEGYNCSDLNWGTANAKTVTMSFWVRSSLTGTFGGSLVNSAVDRSYAFTYAISVADTWEYKTITIAGDTSGVWQTTTDTGIWINFSMGAGSSRVGTAGAWGANPNFGATGQVAVISTLNATWQITGVQLEVGSTATSFDYRPYGTELQLCQRYFGIYDAIAVTSAYTYSFALPASMRASPTCTTTVNTGAGSAFSALGTSYSHSKMQCGVINV
jgi:hypothetical protein